MTKQEFLDGLTKSLLSTGSEKIIRENRSFYNEYIDTELRKGRSEEEVLNELGDPRLIANSIKEAAGIDDEFVGNVESGDPQRDYGAGTDAYGTQNGHTNAYGGGDYHGGSSQQRSGRYQSYDDVMRDDYSRNMEEANKKTKMILYGVLGGLAIFLILVLVLATAVFRLLATYLFPIIVIILVLNVFKKR